MTTLPSDTCSESLKTHKYDKKGQELIIGTLVMKITCTTCYKGTNYKYTKKKIFFKIFTTQDFLFIYTADEYKMY